ncbi:SCO family protein [Anaerobacillus alkaliphilus]|uniref:SCO family protein n=1 Tax=Anaerobacillus alkaliphilus TaxID=1548597 RepID=A0A4Q0VQA1_9BACI|nr:SCO family protein [Anaerobacillus alkaliphilus]RXI98291.1 SCO family protein [Anaerobacillus alkaliphilus]
MKILKLVLFTNLIVLLSGCGFLYSAPETKSRTIVDVSEADWQVAEFEYTNHEGLPFGSNDLKGQYWIANMIFASCPTVCMTMTPNMISLQEEAKKANIDVQFVSFTVDPEFDDPEGLTRYGNAYGADFANYNFLTGYSLEEIKDFARVSFKSIIQEIPDSLDIMHSVNFFLVDGNGKVIRIYDGNTDFNAKAVIKDLKKVVR